MILHLMSRFDNRPVETIVRPEREYESMCLAASASESRTSANAIRGPCIYSHDPLSGPV